MGDRAAAVGRFLDVLREAGNRLLHRFDAERDTAGSLARMHLKPTKNEPSGEAAVYPRNRPVTGEPVDASSATRPDGLVPNR